MEERKHSHYPQTEEEQQQLLELMSQVYKHRLTEEDFESIKEVLSLKKAIGRYGYALSEKQIEILQKHRS